MMTMAMLSPLEALLPMAMPCPPMLLLLPELLGQGPPAPKPLLQYSALRELLLGLSASPLLGLPASPLPSVGFGR